MLTVRFGPIAVQLSPGTRLLDVLDDREDELLRTSCRDANCATCLVSLAGLADDRFASIGIGPDRQFEDLALTPTLLAGHFWP